MNRTSSSIDQLYYLISLRTTPRLATSILPLTFCIDHLIDNFPLQAEIKQQLDDSHRGEGFLEYTYVHIL